MAINSAPRRRGPNAAMDPARRALLLVVVGLVVSSCGSRQDPHRVRLGVSALRISLPAFVAIDRGLFAKHGVDVDVHVFETAQPMMDELSAGRLDAAGYTAYPIAFLSSRGSRPAPVMATALLEDADHRLSYVLARPGSGLAFPRDAAGRRIGILPTAAYRHWLDAILHAAGVDPASVTVVPVAPQLQASTLDGGGVDLMFTNDPAATAILTAGVGEIVDDGPPCATRLGAPFYFGGLALAGGFAADRERAAQVVAAIDEAIAIIDADPEGAVASMARFLPAEQRGHAPHYPRARYLASAAVPPARIADEVAAERLLGIIDFEPEVTAWSPPPP